MGIFGNKKKGKERKGILPSIKPSGSPSRNERQSGRTSSSGSNSPPGPAATTPASASAAASSSSRTSEQPASTRVIKYVGEYKHVTEFRLDENGQQQESTTVTKLTPQEIEELGHVIGNEASAATSGGVTPSSMDQYFGGGGGGGGDITPAKLTPSNPSSNHNTGGGQQQQQQQTRHEPVPQVQQTTSQQPGGMVGGTGDGTGGIIVPQQQQQQLVQNGLSYEEYLAQIEVTRELVKKFISEIWNRGETELIPHVCHPSLRFNGHVGMDKVSMERCFSCSD